MLRPSCPHGVGEPPRHDVSAVPLDHRREARVALVNLSVRDPRAPGLVREEGVLAVERVREAP